MKVVKPNLAEPLSELQLREMLEKQHELCYPLVRWILNSNRSHIVLLPSNKKLSFMMTWQHFLMRNSPPVQDEKFRSMKAKFGSVFAFHGSPLENWHSIVREGLVVASGTDRQLHGAAYGKGIYLSPSLSTSFGYCAKYRSCATNVDTSENKSTENEEYDFLGELPALDFSKMICLALCEVINNKDLVKHGHNIWTCAKQENVCTRFFFVSCINGVGISSSPVDVSQDNRLEEIRGLLKNNI